MQRRRRTTVRNEVRVAITSLVAAVALTAAGCGSGGGDGGNATPGASGVTARADGTGSATLSWNANTEPDVAGHKVYHGMASAVYGAPIDVGNRVGATLTGLGPGTHYFVVTAYDTDGNESGFSNEVSKSFPE